jgi:hypothetical protein
LFFEKITYNDAGQFVSWEDNYLYKAITEYSADGQLALGAKIYDNE